MAYSEGQFNFKTLPSLIYPAVKLPLRPRSRTEAVCAVGNPDARCCFHWLTPHSRCLLKAGEITKLDFSNHLPSEVAS